MREHIEALRLPRGAASHELIEHNAVDWRARLWVFKTEWNFCGGGLGLYGWLSAS
jgi:hypothetical protein